MDDVPAGPASPGLRRPSLSVVVPVRNGGPDFGRCLQRLRGASATEFELIVVDDGSTDDSATIAREPGRPCFRLPAPRGPAAARNVGAQAASSPLVFFLDADVAVHRETLNRALARFENESVALRPLRLVRRRTSGAGAREPVSQSPSSFRPSARAFRRRHPAGPHVLDRLRCDQAQRLSRIRRI